jgi:hypothetical protein
LPPVALSAAAGERFCASAPDAGASARDEGNSTGEIQIQGRHEMRL